MLQQLFVCNYEVEVTGGRELHVHVHVVRVAFVCTVIISTCEHSSNLPFFVVFFFDKISLSLFTAGRTESSCVGAYHIIVNVRNICLLPTLDSTVQYLHAGKMRTIAWTVGGNVFVPYIIHNLTL